MDVCAKVRGILHEKRVGHGGTLDPMATGVLPVFVGRATRAVEFAAEREKEYLAGLRLGQVTDTQDTTGTVLEAHPVDVTPEALEAGRLKDECSNYGTYAACAGIFGVMCAPAKFLPIVLVCFGISLLLFGVMLAKKQIPKCQI